jgi:hypothetical protein
MDLALSSYGDQRLLTSCAMLLALGVTGLLSARRTPWTRWICLAAIVIVLATSAPEYLPSPSRSQTDAAPVSQMLGMLLTSGGTALVLALWGSWRSSSRPAT